MRTFYRVNTDFTVGREDILWRWNAIDEAAGSLLPKMQTDISLTSSSGKLIIDRIFTPEATRRHYEAAKLQSAHLYQINAHMDNLRGE